MSFHLQKIFYVNAFIKNYKIKFKLNFENVKKYFLEHLVLFISELKTNCFELHF